MSTPLNEKTPQIETVLQKNQDPKQESRVETKLEKKNDEFDEKVEVKSVSLKKPDRIAEISPQKIELSLDIKSPNDSGSDKDSKNKQDKKNDQEKDKESDSLQRAPVENPVIKITPKGLDESNQFDFIHELWLHMLFHVICLGVSFHRGNQSGVIVLWAFLHALNFASYIFFHVISNFFRILSLAETEARHQHLDTMWIFYLERATHIFRLLRPQVFGNY